MTKAITIDLFRVSGDSKYLDMIFNCPDEYYFTSLELEVRFVENGTFKSKFFDLSVALFDDVDTHDQQKWTVRLPLDKIGIEVPAIYIGTFKARLKEINSLDSELFDKALCSDVNFAYRCMLDDILKENNCELVSDEAIRKYLLLYGHQAALTVRDMETAEVYFKLISNCFQNCASKERPEKHIKPCNCGN